MILKSLLVLAVLITFILGSSTSYAISAPDTHRIISVKSYQDVNPDNSGDLLILVEYELLYDTTPAESIGEAYLSKLLDGTTELDSLQPYSSTIPNSGYENGLFSFYDSDGITVATQLKIRFQGNPALFADPPTVTEDISISSPNTRARLTIDLRALAQKFEATVNWNIDLLEDTAEEGLRLTPTNGEDYFSGAIPDLRTYAPTLFQSIVDVPIVEPELFDKGYEENLRNFWDGTSFDNAMSDLADYLGISKTFFSVPLVIIAAGGIAFYVRGGTRSPVVGIFSALIALSTGATLGLVPLAFINVLALLGIIALGYIFFYVRSTS